MNKRFIEWLNGVLEEKGWSQRELGRRSGQAGATISHVINGQEPTWDFCAAVAGALEMDEDEVFELAGKYRRSKPKGLAEEIASQLKHLPPEQQRLVLDVMRSMSKAGGSAIPAEQLHLIGLPDEDLTRPPEQLNLLWDLMSEDQRDIIRYIFKTAGRRRESSRSEAGNREEETQRLYEEVIDHGPPQKRQRLLIGMERMLKDLQGEDDDESEQTDRAEPQQEGRPPAVPGDVGPTE